MVAREMPIERRLDAERSGVIDILSGPYIYDMPRPHVSF